MKIDVVDERSFRKSRLRFKLRPPLVDAILRPAPPVDFFRAHALASAALSFLVLGGSFPGADSTTLAFGLQKSYAHPPDSNLFPVVSTGVTAQLASGFLCRRQKRQGDRKRRTSSYLTAHSD